MTQPGPPDDAAPAAALEALEDLLLGGHPSLTRVEVCERAGVALEDASHLWHLLGFPHSDDDEVAFTETDVRSLQHTKALIDLGILDQERQDGLVRTWGRSFARLAEWQVDLLTEVSADLGVDLAEGVTALSEQVLPLVEDLQSIVWKRHLMGAWSRVMVSASGEAHRAVCFVDIVGYTSRSKTMTDRELVSWLEDFESAALDTVLEHDGRIIKNIGDELLLVTDTAEQAAAIACKLTHRGEDPDDPFPSVRAGVAYGDVVLRLGDVFGPVVNIASRLTSVARPGTVLIDEGTYLQLTGREHHDDDDARDEDDHDAPYRLRRLRRLSVKGYSRLKAWSLRPRSS
ncbi:adenylate/guanylate cyclase domain-containing protein [Nocardioides panacisoli]|uniref:Adenylate/guanylate cyclase domain-containing protein n=1 Tax=Nocardioides panacisoli TaxID=627624 RepID=A0ABP7II44_9ACTN